MSSFEHEQPSRAHRCHGNFWCRLPMRGNPAKLARSTGATMSSQGNEKRAALIEREARRPMTVGAIVRFLVIFGALTALTFWVAGCALEPPEQAAMMPTRTIKKTVTKRVEVKTPVCPTDGQLRELAIAASRATYQQAPGGERSCACPTDSYVNRGVTLPCNGPGAIKPSSWAMCTPEHVPQTLVDQMRGKIAACSKV